MGSGGNKPFRATNGPYGAPITYYLKDKGPAKIEILDGAGKVIRDLGPIAQEAGLNRVTWDLRYQGPHLRRPPDPEQDAEGGGFRFRPIGRSSSWPLMMKPNWWLPLFAAQQNSRAWSSRSQAINVASMRSRWRSRPLPASI